MLHSSIWERGVRKHERNKSADTKDTGEAEGGGAPGTRAKVPLQPMMQTMVRQVVPPEPRGSQWIRYAPAGSPRQALCWSRWLCPEQSCSFVPTQVQAPGRSCRLCRRDHTETSFLDGFGSPWGTTVKQSIPEGLLRPVEQVVEHVCEELQPSERTLEKVMKDYV